MRISTSVINDLATKSMSNSYENYYNIVNKISSGKNFTKVSEDVTDATKVIKLDDKLAKMNEYQSNIKTALDQMNTAYDALADVSDEITSINSLIVEAANATTTPESAKAIAVEIKERVASIADRMNTKYLDDYIFSGTNTSSKTYSQDEDGNYIYNGTSAQAGARNLTISEGTTFTYNTTATEIFEQDSEGNDFFSEMNELYSLLTPDDGKLDYSAIREKLSATNSAQDKVSQVQGNFSAKVSKLDTTKALNESTITSLTESKANIEEVDITKAATDLATAQTALQASYFIGNSVLSGLSLLDYI